MQAKCKHLVLKGKYIKKHLQFTLDVIAILRFIPTLPLFSWLWKTFLATLRRLDESTLADWLQNYERPIPAIFRDHVSADIVYTSFWVGFDGIIPGSGSGSEPAEAIHASWQRELAQLGGRGNIGHALHVLQKLYTDHWQKWYSWNASTPLSFMPPGQDGQLINGTALARAGRTTAANFAKLPQENMCLIQHCDQLSWVAFASSYITAKPYARIEGAANTDATKHFDSTEPSGIVHYGWTPVSPVTQIPLCQHRVFEGYAALCSCPAAAMHAQCEHATFVCSLKFPNCPKPSVILEALPCAQNATGVQPRPPRCRANDPAPRNEAAVAPCEPDQNFAFCFILLHFGFYIVL